MPEPGRGTLPEAVPEAVSIREARTAPRSRPLDEVLRAAAARLVGAGIAGGRADAVALAGHLLDVGPGEVERRAILREPAPAGFDALLDLRAQRVPLQHLTGVAAFRHIELSVGPGVFIPRPETELLTEFAVAALDAAPTTAGTDALGPQFVDLCTGSGAIALSIAHERPGARVAAVELSEQAYGYARANADRLGAAIDLRLGDAVSAFEDLAGAVDVVATNPPYIPDGAVQVDPEVRDHDPALALYGGGDGLELPMRLIQRAARLLRPGGVLLVEHGELQGQELRARLERLRAWDRVQDHPDLTGRPRVLRAVRSGLEPVS